MNISKKSISLCLWVSKVNFLPNNSYTLPKWLYYARLNHFPFFYILFNNSKSCYSNEERNFPFPPRNLLLIFISLLSGRFWTFSSFYVPRPRAVILIFVLSFRRQGSDGHLRTRFWFHRLLGWSRVVCLQIVFTFFSLAWSEGR